MYMFLRLRIFRIAQFTRNYNAVSRVADDRLSQFAHCSSGMPELPPTPRYDMPNKREPLNPSPSVRPGFRGGG